MRKRQVGLGHVLSKMLSSNSISRSEDFRLFLTEGAEQITSGGWRALLNERQLRPLCE